MRIWQAGEKFLKIKGSPKIVPDGVSMYPALHSSAHAKLMEKLKL